MTDNTLALYGDYVMASRTDDFFRWLTTEQMPTWADGEVDAPVGWFAIVRPETEDFYAYAQQDGDPYVGGWVKVGNWFLVQIDTLGFVYTVSYEGLDGLRSQPGQQRRALADFSRLTRMYRKWATPQNPLPDLDADWKIIRNLADAIGECVSNVTATLMEEFGLDLDEETADALSDYILDLATTGRANWDDVVS